MTNFPTDLPNDSTNNPASLDGVPESASSDRLQSGVVLPPPIEQPAIHPALFISPIPAPIQVSGASAHPSSSLLSTTVPGIPSGPGVTLASTEPFMALGQSRASSFLHSLTLLSTMAIMLLLARYSVPRIVEEIRYSWHRGEMRAEYETGGEGLRNVSLDSLSRAYEMVTSAVGPSVVHIDVQRRPSEDDKKIQQLLGSDSFALSDQGSGVIVDAEGYILTNRHVILDGQSISVTLSDGRRIPAQIVGTDTLTDLAVLKITATGLLPIRWGDSQKIRVGSPVWAVGSPFGLDRTITFGILSGKHRMVRAGARYGSSAGHQDFMQSDVAVNPGNSGGPLVDARGTLVGINTAILGDTYQGVSFSIPSNVSQQVYQRIRETGRVQRGWLGVVLVEVPDELLRSPNVRVRGALVQSLASPDSPAAVAGLQPSDLVTKIQGEDVVDVGHLMRVIAQSEAGDELTLEIIRNDKVQTVVVLLSDRPGELD